MQKPRTFMSKTTFLLQTCGACVFVIHQWMHNKHQTTNNTLVCVCLLMFVICLYKNTSPIPKSLKKLFPHFPIKHYCHDPGLNQGPLDLQSNALPTELSRLSAQQCTMKDKNGHKTLPETLFLLPLFCCSQSSQTTDVCVPICVHPILWCHMYHNLAHPPQNV